MRTSPLLILIALILISFTFGQQPEHVTKSFEFKLSYLSSYPFNKLHMDRVHYDKKTQTAHVIAWLECNPGRCPDPERLVKLSPTLSIQLPGPVKSTHYYLAHANEWSKEIKIDKKHIKDYANHQETLQEIPLIYKKVLLSKNMLILETNNQISVNGITKHAYALSIEYSEQSTTAYFTKRSDHYEEYKITRNYITGEVEAEWYYADKHADHNNPPPMPQRGALVLGKYTKMLVIAAIDELYLLSHAKERVISVNQDTALLLRHFLGLDFSKLK